MKRLLQRISPFIVYVTVCTFAAAAPFTESAEDNSGISINRTDDMIYPPAMLLAGILTGEAHLVISVDVNGQLSDSLVIGYTNRVFADAALEALKKWTYEPARVHGSARAARTDVLFTFKNDMGVMIQSLPGSLEPSSLFRAMRERYVYQACLLRDLDRIPTPLKVVQPLLPKGGLSPGTKRTVTVEFYIDEAGKVRAPAVDREEANDAYAATAVAAVEQWQFEPPVRKGRPVLVLARQDFNFVPRP